MSAPITLDFIVPGTPPSWQRALRGMGRVYNDPKYEAAKAGVAWAMRKAVGPHEKAFQSCCLSLALELYYPDRRTRDPDRALNLVLDAGKGILWTDDSWTTFEQGVIAVRPRLSTPQGDAHMRIIVARLSDKL